MSRLFDGVDDRIDFGPGALAALNGQNVTVAFLWKTTVAVHAGGICYVGDGAPGVNVFAVNNFSDGNVWFSTANGSQSAIPYTSADGWQIGVLTNVSGANGLRRHVFKYASPGWSHANVAAGIAAGTPPGAVVRVGQHDSAAQFLNGLLAAIGIWNRVLSDAEIETLHSTIHHWKDLGAKWLVTFDQAATSTPVPDLVGIGHQSSIVGTAVSTDEPSPWSYIGSLSTHDIIVSKLKTHYPTTPRNFADLWKVYWADPVGGNGPGGKPKVGEALLAHYGGTGDFAKRARSFWTAYTP